MTGYLYRLGACLMYLFMVKFEVHVGELLMHLFMVHVDYKLFCTICYIFFGVG